VAKICTKIFISFLLVAIFNLLACCYSSEIVTLPEYNQIEEIDKPHEMRVIIKNGHDYHFSYPRIHIENDTLYGKGEMIVSEIEILFEGELALSDVESIEIENMNWVTTSLLCLGLTPIIFF
jgi:hypothetical protein